MDKSLKSFACLIVCILMILCLSACNYMDFFVDSDSNEIGNSTEKGDTVSEGLPSNTSQNKDNIDTTVTATTHNDLYSFATVNDLIIAIKRNPTAYRNKEVTVTGTILKKNTYIAICDLSYVADLSASLDFSVREYSVYTNCKENNMCIDIIIYDDMAYAAVTSGDYVKLSGSIKAADGALYLDDCECEIIKFASERK